jgi:hypothetical protein
LYLLAEQEQVAFMKEYRALADSSKTNSKDSTALAQRFHARKAIVNYIRTTFKDCTESVDSKKCYTTLCNAARRGALDDSWAKKLKIGGRNSDREVHL